MKPHEKRKCLENEWRCFQCTGKHLARDCEAELKCVKCGKCHLNILHDLPRGPTPAREALAPVAERGVSTAESEDTGGSDSRRVASPALGEGERNPEGHESKVAVSRSNRTSSSAQAIEVDEENRCFLSKSYLVYVRHS